MNVIRTIQLTEDQKLQVYSLWNREYPAQLVYNDMAAFETYLHELKDQRHYLLLDDNSKVSGWLKGNLVHMPMHCRKCKDYRYCTGRFGFGGSECVGV